MEVEQAVDLVGRDAEDHGHRADRLDLAVLEHTVGVGGVDRVEHEAVDEQARALGLLQERDRVDGLRVGRADVLEHRVELVRGRRGARGTIA